MMFPLVSIVIPAFNEERYIKECLDSVFLQDYPSEKMEVIVVDGASTDNTKSIIQEFFPSVIVLNNPDRIVPISMNLGISNALGQYIIRLDAHSYYPNDYISQLINAAIKLDSDNVGTICYTDVKEKTPKSIAIKTVLSNKFGVGNSIFRTGTSFIVEVDTVPFGCFKRDVFAKYGKYDERLVRNQDIELNKRIKKGGGRIFLIPNSYCIYFARSNYLQFAKSNYSNGFWNILTVYYTHDWKSMSLRHFIPMIFVASILIPLILTLFNSSFLYISMLSLLAYFICLLFVSFREKIKNRKLSMFYLITAFIMLHVPYGVGSLVGILTVIRLKLKKVLTN